MNHYYITTPIYYVNDKPHIGHAYTSVACDVMARYMRLSGVKVKFLTGTDEHGQKVEKSAAAAGMSPKDFVDQVSGHFRDMTGLLNISNDDFIRTTESRHIAAAQALWAKMQEAGHIYLGKYAGWYSVRDETYYAESEIIDDKAPTGAPVEWVEEPSYFFNLSQWQEKLLAHYDAHPDFIAPASRRNEIISFVKGGLRDLSISRTTFSWGIPVPGDEKHIMYVWLDALTNYLSATGYPGAYQEFWPASLHMVGKDIIRFHAVYWPAFLMAAGIPLPTRIFAHGWWTIEGEKMSKSLGNAIAPAELVEAFGLDQTRYFLMREVPFGNDGNFSRSALIARVNSELANNIGNLVQRTLSMIAKNCEGKIPDLGSADPYNESLLQASIAMQRQVHLHFVRQEFHLALEEIVTLASHANAYIDEQAPWALKKIDPVAMRRVLYVLAEAIRAIALCLQPFMPSAASLILDQLAVDPARRLFQFLDKSNALNPGALLPAPQGVFPRYSE